MTASVLEDTIAAISTPFGAGGISIVRVSGPAALQVYQAIFRPFSRSVLPSSRHLTLGQLFDFINKIPLDQVLGVFMPGPSTYTGENVTEIHCHGSPVITRRALELALSAGSRLAEPGEFTRRAFLNDKMDLAQAEAIAELVNAKCEAAAGAAHKQLSGLLSQKIHAIVDSLVDLLAQAEVSLDYPDEEGDQFSWAALRERLENEAIAPIEDLLAAWKDTRVIREGGRVALVGRPNVGKSSLLNIITQTDAAIVTATPGTTRDLLPVDCQIKGIPLTLVDTAGLRSGALDEIETLGQDRTRCTFKNADLTLLVVDQGAEATEGDFDVLRGLAGRPFLTVYNKSDLPTRLSPADARGLASPAGEAWVSAKTGEGLESLFQAIFGFFSANLPARADESPVSPNRRHKAALDEARAILARIVGARETMTVDLLAADLRLALDVLGTISGKTTPADVLDRIFSSFCLGK